MADSAVGDGDAVILGLVLDVLCRVSRLERSGARCEKANGLCLVIFCMIDFALLMCGWYIDKGLCECFFLL